MPTTTTAPTQALPTAADCTADAFVPLLLAEQRIKAPYTVLWAGCKDGLGGIKVRSATAPDCSPVEVEAVFRWAGSTWTLVEGGRAQAKFCKVGSAVQ